MSEAIVDLHELGIETGEDGTDRLWVDRTLRGGGGWFGYREGQGKVSRHSNSWSLGSKGGPWGPVMGQEWY